MMVPLKAVFSAPTTEEDRIASTPIGTPAERTIRSRGRPAADTDHPGIYRDSDWEQIGRELAATAAVVEERRRNKDLADQEYRMAVVAHQGVTRVRNKMIRDDPRTPTELEGLIDLKRSRISQIKNGSVSEEST